MKGFFPTLVVVCLIIGGIWFAYEPFIKPMVGGASQSFAPDSDVVLGEGETKLGNKSGGDGGGASKPSVSPAAAPPSPGGTSTSGAPAGTASSSGSRPSAPPRQLTELERLLEERYPMPEFLPLLEIVHNWRQVPPNAFPAEVIARETVSFQLVVNGQAIGASNVAPGTPLKPLRLDGEQLTIANAANPAMNTSVHVDQTDFKERITKRYEEFVARKRAEIEARREQIKQVVEEDPSKMALLTGERPEGVGADSGDPRFAAVRESIRKGEVASATIEEAVSFVWNGSEQVKGAYPGTYDTVSVNFEVGTIFGRFPVEYKCLLQNGRVVGWIDPITEERL